MSTLYTKKNHIQTKHITLSIYNVPPERRDKRPFKTYFDYEIRGQNQLLQ